MTLSDVNGLRLAFRWLHTVVLIPICDEVVLFGPRCWNDTAKDDIVAKASDHDLAEAMPF